MLKRRYLELSDIIELKGKEWKVETSIKTPLGRRVVLSKLNDTSDNGRPKLKVYYQTNNNDIPIRKKIPIGTKAKRKWRWLDGKKRIKL